MSFASGPALNIPHLGCNSARVQIHLYNQMYPRKGDPPSRIHLGY